MGKLRTGKDATGRRPAPGASASSNHSASTASSAAALPEASAWEQERAALAREAARDAIAAAVQHVPNGKERRRARLELARQAAVAPKAAAPTLGSRSSDLFASLIDSLPELPKRVAAAEPSAFLLDPAAPRGRGGAAATDVSAVQQFVAIAKSAPLRGPNPLAAIRAQIAARNSSVALAKAAAPTPLAQKKQER